MDLERIWDHVVDYWLVPATAAFLALYFIGWPLQDALYRLVGG